MKRSFGLFTIGVISYACLSQGFAAQAIDLAHQPVSVLQTLLAQKPRLAAAATPTSQPALTQLKSEVDFNQTTHIQVQETFSGYPIWGSDAVVHIPHGNARSLTALAAKKEPSDVSMSGTLYQGLNEDLANTPAYVFQSAQAEKAVEQAMKLYRTGNNANKDLSQSTSRLMVYVDQKNKAHWTYLINFFAKPAKGMPALPTYIMDAVSFEVYEQWNDLKTLETVPGGGVGGNEGRVQKLYYDGLSKDHHLAGLEFQRDNNKKLCYLKNDLTIINDIRKGNTVPSFSCEKPDSEHNNVYWSTLDDKTNGGYSPNNDALYSDKIVRQMYKDWFNINMLEKNGKPMQVTMHIHDPNQGQNAFYNNGEMTFGDGDNESYPVTAPSVVGHEMTHGFTEQHSNLVYQNQSGALNESFSDMADKAVQYYVEGKNGWIIDDELLKDGGRPLRWMDQPEKDGASISHTSQYDKLVSFCRDNSQGDPQGTQSCVVHLASGVFNKAFYLIATGWADPSTNIPNTKKAFEVMTQANRFYWKPSNLSYDKAACGVIKATKDYKYDATVVVDAMKQVGIDTSKC